MNVQAFLYKRGYEQKNGYDWYYITSSGGKISSQIKNSLLKKYADLRNNIDDGVIKRGFGLISVLQQEAIVYRIEHYGNDEQGRKYNSLWGFYIDKDNYKFFIANLSLFMAWFYSLSNDYLQVNEDLKKQIHYEEVKLKDFITQNLEELDEQLQKFRLNLDIYLISNLEWKQMNIIETNDGTLDFEIYNKEKKNIKRGFIK